MNVYKYSDETRQINAFIANEVKKLGYLNKVIENIPYKQIAPNDFVIKQKKLYKLNYKKYFGHITTHTYRYMFSKEILEKLIKVMENVTIEMQNQLIKSLKEYINNNNFDYYNEEKIESMIKKFGYYDIEIEDVSTKIELLFLKKELPKIRKQIEYNCEYCRDGGCPHCSPSFFY